MSESSTLRSFDAFPKVNTAYKRQSTRGGLATLVIGVLCFYFLCSELRGYSNGHEEHIYTVTKDLAETIQLNVDVTVAMPCKSIKVIAQDYSEDTFFAHELLNMQGLTYDFGTDRMQHEIHSHKAYEMNSKTLKRANSNTREWARILPTPTVESPARCPSTTSKERSRSSICPTISTSSTP